jgi:hypothetical protein
VVLLLLWHNRLAHHANQFQTITGKGYRPRIIDPGPGATPRRPPGAIFVL